MLFISLFFGFGTGISICMLMHSMDTTVRSVEEAEQTLNLPVIAAVPHLKKTKAASVWKGMPMISEPYSVTAESFRSLRTVLELKDISDRQILLVTSAVPNEGKTFCATNIAVALAQQGYRTLLIDTDLRNPSVAKALHRPVGERGLADFLTGACMMEQAIQTVESSEVSGLSVITAGTGARTPSELLSGDRLARVFNDPALAQFERIILDTAPVNAVSDVLHLVKYATSTCLVLRAGHTPAKATQRAYAALVGARVLDAGIVRQAGHGLGINPEFGSWTKKAGSAKAPPFSLGRIGRTRGCRLPRHARRGRDPRIRLPARPAGPWRSGRWNRR